MVGEPLRVLFVDHESRLSGGQQDLLDLVRALPGHLDVHVALPEQGPLSEALQAGGTSVHLIDMSPSLRKVSRWDLKASPQRVFLLPLAIAKASSSIGRIIDETRPHLIHTNSMKAHLLALPVAKSRDVPVIWHVRDILNRGWLRTIFAWLGSHGPTRIVCISECVQEQFRGHQALGRTQVIYNGIDLDSLRDASEKRWRRRLAPRGGIAVGLVGQIARWKGQDLLIQAAARVTPEHPHAKFFIVGECLFPENEGAFESELHRMVDDLGLQERVEFLGWTDEPLEVMKALDIVVHASRLPEPFGRVIVEGMAAGKPVVASSLGAGSEIVGPGEGVLIDPSNVQSLEVALETLLGDAALRAQMGTKAASAARRFSIDRTAKQVVDLYAELMPAEKEPLLA